MRIKAIKNFGHLGANVSPETVMDVEPEAFGGTYEDFLKAGFFEELGSEEQGTESRSKANAEDGTKAVPSEAEKTLKPGSSASSSDR